MSSELDNAVQTLQTEISALPNLIVGPTLAEIFRNLEPILQRLNSMESSFENTNAMVSSLPNNIVEPTLEELFRTLLPMQENLTANKSALGTLEETLTLAETSQSQTSKALTKDVSKLAEDLQTAQLAITQLPNQVAAPILEEVFRTLLPMKEALASANQDLKTLDADLKNPELKNKLNAVYENLSTVQKSLSQHHEINSSTASGIQTSISDLANDFQEKLAANQEQMEALPNKIVSPALEEIFRTLLPMRDALSVTNQNLETLDRQLKDPAVTNQIHGVSADISKIGQSLSQHQNLYEGTSSNIENSIQTLSENILEQFEHSQVKISALPNQIVSPTLDEVFRNLEPIVSKLRETLTTVQRLESQLAYDMKVHKQNHTNTRADIQSVTAQIALLHANSEKKIYQHEEAFRALDIAALSTPERHERERRPKPVSSYYPEAFLYQLKDFRPDLYDTWKRLFDTAAGPYIEAPNKNCSSWTSAHAKAFKNYVKIYNRGQVLDIGCGPHADPMYLQGLPAERLSALEPLEIVGTPRFPIYRGVNEFIPFKDKSFQTVINATALDHVIDIERALEETARVLDTDGVFVVWYANVKTAVNPVTDFDGPLDDYHLFHTNDEWFLPMLAKHFHTVDRRVYPANSTIDDVFAVYQKK